VTRATGFSKEPRRRPLTQRVVKLVPRAEVPQEHRPPLLPGRKSRRRRMNVWMP
jgi:hypothetical protein